MSLNISTKKTGDKLTATEFNAVVDGINANSDAIEALQQADVNQQKVVNDVAAAQNLQAQSIKTLQTQTVKMVVLKQEEYDALVEAGTLDADTYYNILEE
ncbi:MAG: hypothetical protein ACOCNX_01080 [Prevotella sp.]